MENRQSMHEQEEILNKLRKELKITRYCSIFVAVLLIVVIAGGVYMMNAITPMVAAMQKMQPAIEKMADLDVEMLNEKIAQLDIEGLNQAIAGLDTEEVSEALKNINEAVERLQEIGDGLSTFSDSVNNSISGLFGNISGI